MSGRASGAAIAHGRRRVVTAACSCSGRADALPPPPLSNTFESPEALARRVLDALARDRISTRLRALALIEAEFRDARLA